METNQPDVSSLLKMGTGSVETFEAAWANTVNADQTLQSAVSAEHNV